MQTLETPNGIYQVKEITPELIKRLSKPYRKPAIKKPCYDYTVEESEKKGVVYPTRERLRRENAEMCKRFNDKFHAYLGSCVADGMLYNDVNPPILVTKWDLDNWEEIGVVVPDNEYKWRNSREQGNKKLREISQTVQDDILQEDCGDVENRMLCIRWTEKFHALGGIGSGYRYMGLDKPVPLSDYTVVERDTFLKSHGVKLTGMKDIYRNSLCKKLLYEIRKEVES